MAVNKAQRHEIFFWKKFLAKMYVQITANEPAIADGALMAIVEKSKKYAICPIKFS